MLHDPETYANPMDFVPERYLASPGKLTEPDPHIAAFGFGRRYGVLMNVPLRQFLISRFWGLYHRICPGIYVAEATIFIAVASLLTVFNVEKAVENGVPITPRVRQTPGLIRFVVFFPSLACYFT